MTEINNQVFYLQDAYGELPAGLPMVKTQPTSAHLQANALLRHETRIAVEYFRPIGDDHVYALEYGQLDTVHPKDPSRVGLHVISDVKIECDRLTEVGSVTFSIERSFPIATLVVVVDDRSTTRAIHDALSLNAKDAFERALVLYEDFHGSEDPRDYWYSPHFDERYRSALTAFEDNLLVVEHKPAQ